MKIILMSGGSGALGAEIQKINDKFQILAPHSQQMDIRNYKQVEAYAVRIVQLENELETNKRMTTQLIKEEINDS